MDLTLDQLCFLSTDMHESFVNPSTLYCLIYWYNIALYVILFLHLILIKLFFIKCLSSFDFLFDNQIRMRCKFMNNEKKENYSCERITLVFAKVPLINTILMKKI